MNKLVPGSCGLILLTILSGSAMAADLSLRPPVHTKAPTMAPRYNWTGLYIGINGGAGWGAAHFDFPRLGTTTGARTTSARAFDPGSTDAKPVLRLPRVLLACRQNSSE
jgi:hypothetical protein